MDEKSQEQRLRNLRNLGKVMNAWHFVYAIIFVTFFPYLTKGTEIHEQVVTMSRYGALGILIAPIYMWWLRLLLQWYMKTGRNLESLTLLPMLLVGALIAASVSYVILRIFKHDGNWSSTLAISQDDVTVALCGNLFMALFVCLAILTIPYYRAGKNIILRDGKPTPFWQIVVILLSLPVILALAVIAGQVFK